MYLWTRNSPLNIVSHLDPDLDFGSPDIGSPDSANMDMIRLDRGVRSPNALVVKLIVFDKFVRKGKGKRGCCTARHREKALRYGTRSQGIAQFYLYNTPRSCTNGMNNTCLCLPSRSLFSFTYPEGMEG